ARAAVGRRRYLHLHVRTGPGVIDDIELSVACTAGVVDPDHRNVADAVEGVGKTPVEAAGARNQHRRVDDDLRRPGAAAIRRFLYIHGRLLAGAVAGGRRAGHIGEIDRSVRSDRKIAELVHGARVYRRGARLDDGPGLPGVGGTGNPDRGI